MAYGRNGFGGFGGGQMQQLMKQAQKMQEDIKIANEELDNAEIKGTSGGGAVTPCRRVSSSDLRSQDGRGSSHHASS